MALENCTCSIEYDGVDLFNIILIVGFLPIMAIVGLFVNVLNTMIYMKNYGSSSRYLTALSISDFGKTYVKKFKNSPQILVFF